MHSCQLVALYFEISGLTFHKNFKVLNTFKVLSHMIISFFISSRFNNKLTLASFINPLISCCRIAIIKPFSIAYYDLFQKSYIVWIGYQFLTNLNYSFHFFWCHFIGISLHHQFTNPIGDFILLIYYWFHIINLLLISYY